VNSPQLSLGPVGTATSQPVVAIVGRPNVGKSSLFNRLVGSRKAIVERESGTTRDRLYGEAEWHGRRLTLIDTGGLEPSTEEEYAPLVRHQVETAIREADVILSWPQLPSGALLQPEQAHRMIVGPLRRKAPLLLSHRSVPDERGSRVQQDRLAGLLPCLAEGAPSLPVHRRLHDPASVGDHPDLLS